MGLTVDELIEQLRDASAEGFGSARVLVRCDSFELVDMDSDGDVKSFDNVPSTGVEEYGGFNGNCYLVIGRDDPEEVKRRMCDSGWWGEPLDDEHAKE